MTRYETLAPVLEKKGYDATIQEINKKEKDIYGENSTFLYHFDLGTLYHYNGDYKNSIKHFEQAEQIYDELFTKSVTNEAASLLVNDNVRPYRARPFELVMLYQYQIMNYLALRDIDGAAVEVRRSEQAMESLYQKDKDKVNDNGFLRYLSAIVYEMAGEEDDAAISYIQAAKAYEEGNIEMPKEVWEFINESLSKMDRSDDLKALKMSPVQSTPKATKAREQGQEIVVVGYAGHSPILGELYMSGTFVSGAAMNLTYKDGETGKTESFTIVTPPVSGFNGNTFHLGFAIPEKKRLSQKTNNFTIKLDGRDKFVPEKVVSVNKELERNIEDEKSATILRTIVRVATRTIAAQVAKEKTQTGNGFLNLVKNVAIDVGQSQMEQADLRMGLFLPNSLFATRIPVEAGEHQLKILAHDKKGRVINEFASKVKVGKGQKAFIFVPSIE